MKRLNYVDGLKGWCAVSVCVFHFLLMFMIGGFIGWKCLPDAVAKYSKIKENAAELYPNDIDKYIQYKSPCFEELYKQCELSK